MLFKGRRKIITDFTIEDLIDSVGNINMLNLAKLLNSSMNTHILNKEEIDYLINYSHGEQPILSKTKLVRPEINNTLVLNHAQMVTRSIIGYFLGTPIQYIQNGNSAVKTQIDELNRYVAYEDKSSTDKEIGEYQSICGTAYRIIYTDGVLADEVPFEDKALDPATTYVVYENSIAEKPVIAVTYYRILDAYNTPIGTRLYVYTEKGYFEITSMSDIGFVSQEDIVVFNPYLIGGIPIIEYPNNIWRIGDWELCLGLMDAINDLHSGRLDDIDQVVQSLLVFINADLDEDKYAEMRESGIILLRNNTQNQASVDTISNPLDQSGMKMFSDELELLLYALLGIPDRSGRKGGGGDTGQAVELRDGWADLEVVARNKELVYKKAEKQTLRIILNIMRNTLGFDLSLLDIDIKFSRNKNNNLLVKTQAYQNLLATKTLDPKDCLTIVDLVSDVTEYIDRGEKFWGDSFANKIVPVLQDPQANKTGSGSDGKDGNNTADGQAVNADGTKSTDGNNV